MRGGRWSGGSLKRGTTVVVMSSFCWISMFITDRNKLIVNITFSGHLTKCTCVSFRLNVLFMDSKWIKQYLIVWSGQVASEFLNRHCLRDASLWYIC